MPFKPPVTWLLVEHNFVQSICPLFKQQLNPLNYQNLGCLSWEKSLPHFMMYLLVSLILCLRWPPSTETSIDSAVTFSDSCTRLLVLISLSDSWPSALKVHNCFCLSLASHVSSPSCSQINIGPPDTMQEMPLKLWDRSFCSGNEPHQAKLSDLELDCLGCFHDTHFTKILMEP